MISMQFSVQSFPYYLCSGRESLRPRPALVEVKAKKNVKAEVIIKEDNFIEQKDNEEDENDEISVEKESLVKARGMEIHYFLGNTM